MFIVGLLSWWYGDGWRQRALMVRERLLGAIDYFSVDLLLKSLFSPYRQISAGGVRGPIGVRWRAFVDRLISRCVGAVIRTVVIIIGCVSIVLIAVLGLLVLALWLVIPLAPLTGVIMMIVGWVPRWM